MISIDEVMQLLKKFGIEVPDYIRSIDDLHKWILEEEEKVDSRIKSEVAKLRVIRGVKELIEADIKYIKTEKQ